MGRILFFGIGVCLAAAVSLGQQTASRTIGQWLEEGARRDRAGDFAKACDAYARAAEKATGAMRRIALERLAGVQTKMNRYDKAIETYQKLMSECDVSDLRRYSALGSIFRLAQHMGKAREYVDNARSGLDTASKGLSTQAANELAWRTRSRIGDFCFSMGWHKEAVADYEAALGLAPPTETPRIHQQLLQCREKLNDYPGVIKECTALLAMHDRLTLTPYRQKLAQAYFITGDADLGIAALAEADTSCITTVAETLIHDGQFKACQNLLDTALGKSPGDLSLLCVLAKLRWNSDRCAEALEIYRGCYARMAPTDVRFFETASSIAGVHMDKKDIDEAAVAERKKLDALLAQQDSSDAHRAEVIRCLLLAGLMEHDACDYTAALRHLTDLVGLSPQGSRLAACLEDQRTRTALDAVSDAICAGRLSDADAALAVLKRSDFCKRAGEYAEYAVLDRKGETERAAAKLQRIRALPFAADGSDSYAPYFLSVIGLMDLAAEEWERVCLRASQDRGGDRMAAIRLGEYFSQQGRYAEAIRWFERADLMPAHSSFLRHDVHWRRTELEARLNAAHGDPEALSPYLGAKAVACRVAALEVLRDVGVPKQIPLIRKAERDMPEEMRPSAEAALVGIRSRYRFQLDLGLETFDEDTLRKTVTQNFEFLWMKPDPTNRDLRWVGLKARFVLLADLRLQALHDFSGALGCLEGPLPTPLCMAFSPETVWVGADRGAFAYDRAARKWSQYAIGGTMLDVAVDQIEPSGSGWKFHVKGKGAFLFNPLKRTWAEAGP